MTAYQRERESLGQRLRDIRRDAQLTGRGLAATCRWQPSKISKIEAGKQTPTEPDVRAWATACSAAETIPDLIASLRTLDSHYVEHRRFLRNGFARGQKLFEQLEKTTSFVRNFQTAYVPGLLQTADYARCMLRDSLSTGASVDLDDAVAARMARQQGLYTATKRFHFVITEAALRYTLCSRAVMTAQLDRLVSAATVQTIHFGVIPSSARFGTVTPGHGFVIYDKKSVAVETLTAQLKITEPSEVDTYIKAFAELASIAVYGAEARALLTQVLSETSLKPE